MFYGSIVTLIITRFRGAELLFETSFSYISSLLYLSIFGSIFAFVSYLKLIEKVGPGRAGYVNVVMPVLALIISTIFENLEWQYDLIMGLPILIIGAVLVINQKIKSAQPSNSREIKNDSNQKSQIFEAILEKTEKVNKVNSINE